MCAVGGYPGQTPYKKCPVTGTTYAASILIPRGFARATLLIVAIAPPLFRNSSPP